MSRDDNSIALILEEGRKITYHDFGLNQKEYIKNMPSRSLVIMLCSNTEESITFYAACLNNGIVPMLLEEGISEEKLINIIKCYNPNYMFMTAHRKISVKYENSRTIKTYILYELNKNQDVIMHPDLALLLSTSGSTGSSKFVRISYDNIKSNTLSIIEYLEIRKNDISITMLPMSYTYGLSVINTHLYTGATIVVTNKKVVRRDFWNLVNRNKVSSIVGVPFTYEAIQRIALNQIENSAIRVMTQAGGKLPEDLQIFYGEFASKNDIKFYIMYGQTEATARISYLPYEQVLKKIGSAGKAIPNGNISISNEGEIIYKGKNVCMGYAADYTDLCLGDKFNGILKTGDTGYIDEDGFLYVTGRLNNISKLHGKRINLDELEHYLYKKFFVQFICIVKKDKIYIQFENTLNEDDLTEEISRFLKINSKNIKCVKKKFKRNINGKIMRIYE